MQITCKNDNMKLIFKGNIDGISKEEIRAVFYATDSILRYHNVTPYTTPITVRFTDKDMGKTKTGSKAIGRCFVKKGLIEINRKSHGKFLSYSKFMTIAIHEMIHIYFRFPDGEKEKLTSTLTAKLKNDVSKLANILVENTYQRAGYIAHTKIAYKPKGDDFYDRKQYHKNHAESKGKKYRRKKPLCQ